MIEWPAGGERARQVPVTDEAGSILDEGGIAEDVIGMAVRVDDVADRLVGPGANRRKQLPPLANAAAGVDHRNRARRR